MTTSTRQETRAKRHLRVRRKVRGTSERPRLCVCKSTRHLYVQVIDDMASARGSVSLMQLTTNSKEYKSSGIKNFCTREMAVALGKKIAQELKVKGIDAIVFDRSGYKYHGVVKALADSVREAGISF